MQNQYTGDIGDYGKYILLNALAGTDIRLAVVWYLNPYVDKSADGKFTEYLSDAMEKRYRSASPTVYDALRKIIRKGDRQVSFVREEGILPPDTIFYENSLDYLKAGGLARGRKRAREAWLLGALKATSEAKLVFFDPDNGLEVKSHAAYSKLGAKYIFENEIRILGTESKRSYLSAPESVRECQRTSIERIGEAADDYRRKPMLGDWLSFLFR